MISKEEREKDKTICEAATPGPLVAWCDAPGRVRGWSVCTTDGDGLGEDDVANDCTEADAIALANAVNRLPAYIVDAEEMERRIATLEDELREVQRAADRSRTGGVSVEARDAKARWESRAATLSAVLLVLRGGQ